MSHFLQLWWHPFNGYVQTVWSSFESLILFALFRVSFKTCPGFCMIVDKLLGCDKIFISLYIYSIQCWSIYISPYFATDILKILWLKIFVLGAQFYRPISLEVFTMMICDKTNKTKLFLKQIICVSAVTPCAPDGFLS